GIARGRAGNRKAEVRPSCPLGAGAGLCWDGTLASPAMVPWLSETGDASVPSQPRTASAPTDNDLAHSAMAIASISAMATISHSAVAESAGALVDAACALSGSVGVADE